MQRSRSEQDRHELHKAYNIIFGEDPRGTGLILEREALARTFRDRAYQFRPDRAKELGRSRKELQEALKSVALAFDFLADVVGPAKSVWVQPCVDDKNPNEVRAWAPRSAPASSVKLNPPAPSPEIEQATRRIKDAVERLKAHTESLAKNARSPQPAQVKAREATAPATSPADSKTMILGRHLHRQGLITLRQLIAAVAWQRAQRPAVGQIARSWGVLTEDQILEVLREKDRGELFCAYAVRKGMMTPFQRLAVVGRQRVMQKPIGNYFIQQGILTEEQIEEEVERLRTLKSR